jgi:hypothetical protein
MDEKTLGAEEDDEDEDEEERADDHPGFNSL